MFYINRLFSYNFKCNIYNIFYHVLFTQCATYDTRNFFRKFFSPIFPFIREIVHDPQ